MKVNEGGRRGQRNLFSEFGIFISQNTLGDSSQTERKVKGVFMGD
jgi:hypothetical protein